MSSSDDNSKPMSPFARGMAAFGSPTARKTTPVSSPAEKAEKASPAVVASPFPESDEFLALVTTGISGLDELRDTIPADPAVYYALLRFTFGSGTFKRDKLLLLQIPSENYSTIAKARVMGRKGEIKRIIGDAHAELTIDNREDITVDFVLERIKHIAAENVGSSAVSIKQMKEEYEAMLEAMKSKKKSDGAPLDPLRGDGRKTATDLGIQSKQILEAVRDPMGVFNWALYRPTEKNEDLSLINAGSLSVNECKRFLKPDVACFGLLRIGFGTGRFRRTKYVFFSFAGPKLSVAQKANAAATKNNLKEQLGPASIDIQLSSADEFTPEHVIERMRALPGLEGEIVNAQNEINLANFELALAEEAQRASLFFGEEPVHGDDDAPEVPLTPTTASAAVRSGEKIWALFRALA